MSKALSWQSLFTSQRGREREREKELDYKTHGNKAWLTQDISNIREQNHQVTSFENKKVC